MDFIILLPPSQRKHEGGDQPPITVCTTTTEILEEIERHTPEEVYSSRIEEAAELNGTIADANTMPAIKRYDGVVYRALEYETLTNPSYIDSRVQIVSSMFGLLKSTDPIPNYKLSMTSLGVYKKWREVLDISDVFVIDLLASTQRKALSYADGVIVEFTRTKNGKVVKAGHAGKEIKGKFVRWMAESNITSVDDMYNFSEDGYSWNGEAFHKD